MYGLLTHTIYMHTHTYFWVNVEILFLIKVLPLILWVVEKVAVFDDKKPAKEKCM